MAKIKVNNKQINSQFDIILDNVIRNTGIVGKNIMKGLVDDAITSWYSSFGLNSNPNSIIKSMKYTYITRKRTDSVFVDVYAEIDKDAYTYYTSHYSIYDWKKRHELENFSPQDFLINLQWKQGILGLPERGEMTSWVNNHFHQSSETLFECVKNNVNNKWTNKVKEAKIM